VKAKYSATMSSLFRETFCWLPLAHLLNGRVLVLHGGLFSKDGVTLDDLRAIDRYRWGAPVPLLAVRFSERGGDETRGSPALPLKC
jgi:diadenosine tetraphosphatase ApaH/serine/threonine PP2A family protein phosphatase